MTYMTTRWKHFSGMMAALLLTVFLCACEKKQAAAVPTEQTELLLEILTDMDMEKYAVALPKIRRYQTIDETNAFIAELEAVAITNDTIQKLMPLLKKRDYEAADKLMQQLLREHDSRTDRVEISRIVANLNAANKFIRKLSGPLSAAQMAEAADDLKYVAKNLPDAKILLQYANRKAQDAVELERLEQDRRFAWCCFEALDARAAGNSRTADTIAAYIAANQTEGSRNAMVVRLLNDGMFNVAEPDSKREPGKK